jgi:hypothetical protein
MSPHRWRRTPPPPRLTEQDPEAFSQCFVHHTPEPIDDDTYRVCGECGHVYTAEQLAAAHNDIIEEHGLAPDHRVTLRNVDAITTCPHCAHGF